MTTTTELLDQVHAEARELRPLRVLLSIIAAVPFVLGVVVGTVVRVAWVVFAWCWAAGVVGFRTGRAVKDER